jgi:hypothetical protein
VAVFQPNAVRDRCQVRSRGICSGRSGEGVGFCDYSDFACQFSSLMPIDHPITNVFSLHTDGVLE